MAHGTSRERPAILPALGLLAGVALAAYVELPLDFTLAPAAGLLLGAMAARRRSSRWATALLSVAILLSGAWLEDRARTAHRASVESLFPANRLVRELDFVG